MAKIASRDHPRFHSPKEKKNSLWGKKHENPHERVLEKVLLYMTWHPTCASAWGEEGKIKKGLQTFLFFFSSFGLKIRSNGGAYFLGCHLLESLFYSPHSLCLFLIFFKAQTRLEGCGPSRFCLHLHKISWHPFPPPISYIRVNLLRDMRGGVFFFFFF